MNLIAAASAIVESLEGLVGQVWLNAPEPLWMVVWGGALLSLSAIARSRSRVSGPQLSATSAIVCNLRGREPDAGNNALA